MDTTILPKPRRRAHTARTHAAKSQVVTVYNVAPALTIDGPWFVSEGDLYTLSLSSYDPGEDPLNQWVIDWGDKSSLTVSGAATQATHVFADGKAAGVIKAYAVQDDGMFEPVGWAL
jgi:hypothetical protein